MEEELVKIKLKPATTTAIFAKTF